MNISPSGTPLGEPASRESNVTGLFSGGEKYQKARINEQDHVQGHRAGPALCGLGSPPIPLERRARDAAAPAAAWGDPGAGRPALALPAALVARTCDGLAAIATLDSAAT